MRYNVTLIAEENSEYAVGVRQSAKIAFEPGLQSTPNKPKMNGERIEDRVVEGEQDPDSKNIGKQKRVQKKQQG